jgi:hypothetical protein
MIHYVHKTPWGYRISRIPHPAALKFESLSAAQQYVASQNIRSLADAIFATGPL